MTAKKIYSEEDNQQFMELIMRRYTKVNGTHRILNPQSGETDPVLFCQEYFLRYKTAMGLADNTRESKRMIDMMYRVISRFHTHQLEQQLLAGKEIDACIGHYSRVVAEYLQPYKHRNLVGQWVNKFTKKYLEFQQHHIPIVQKLESPSKRSQQHTLCEQSQPQEDVIQKIDDLLTRLL